MADYKIMVVDDSATMRQLIIFALKKLPNTEFIEASDGMDALKKMASSDRAFDLFLLDINMPLLDGVKLVSLVRKDTANADAPIIMITTEAGEADREKAMALGANDYLVKPIQSRALYKEVAKILGIEVR